MAISGPALTTALNALRRYAREVDRAAERIAAAGLLDASEPPSPASATATPLPGAGGGEMGEAIVSMMIAQRAFSAQLRVLKTADQMLQETVEAGTRSEGL